MKYLEEPSWKGSTEIRICITEKPNERAQFAIELLGKLAIVALKSKLKNKESGLTEYTLVPDYEIVERACEIANIAFNEFDRRGWLLHLPLPKLRQDENLPPSSSDSDS